MVLDDELSDITKAATTARSPAKRMVIRATPAKKLRVEPTETNESRVNIPRRPSVTVQSEPVPVAVRSEPVQVQRGDFSVS
jgi:late competence protein required for DNA uptake (superfamily II DNA/RNA helicase)